MPSRERHQRLSRRLIALGPLSGRRRSAAQSVRATFTASSATTAASWHLVRAASTAITADEEADIADAVVTLCVHAGIAASDVICCARLGQHAQGDDHIEAVALLGRADSGSAKHLRALLSMKAKAEYSHSSVTATDTERAVRAAEALSDTARRVSAI